MVDQQDVTAVILVGGKSLRFSGGDSPKCLALYEGRPVLWHILKHHIEGGVKRFVLPLGHHAFEIARAVDRLDLHHSFPGSFAECFDTGLDTDKAERIWRVRDRLPDRFMVSYGDVLSDVDIARLLRYHANHKKMATVTAGYWRADVGIICANTITGGVFKFNEKPLQLERANVGYMVFRREALETFRIFDSLETGVLPDLASRGELMMHLHLGWWKRIETVKDLE